MKRGEWKYEQNIKNERDITKQWNNNSNKWMNEKEMNR